MLFDPTMPQDGLILRGEALIIPLSERGKVLESIHEGHLGISKCQLPDSVFTGLVSMPTSGRWLKHAQHANDTTHRNHDNHSNPPQHLNDHGNTWELTTSVLTDPSI